VNVDMQLELEKLKSSRKTKTISNQNKAGNIKYFLMRKQTSAIQVESKSALDSRVT